MIKTVRGPYCKLLIEPLNLNSADQVKTYLLSVGWQPTQWNINKETRERTSPKLTEDSFNSINDDTGKLLARRAVLVHRRGFLQNLKDPENKGLLSYIRDDGRVPAGSIACATNTGRTKHRVIVNVPKADSKVVYGKELRSIFKVNHPYVLLGSDLAAIEARVAGHYAWQFDNGLYWRTMTSVPDIHQHTADLIGSTRDGAKRFRYAIMYGAQAQKLSTTLGCTVQEAEKKIAAFWAGEPGIKAVIDYLEKFHKKHGFIVGLDGRKLHIRQKHKLFNTLIQAAAAVIFKRWSLLAQLELEERGLDCQAIMSFHDEIQYRCLAEHADIAREVVASNARAAGEYYNLRVEVAADCKVAMDWSGTH